ncbi:MAG: phosphatidate cytidylyltransferase, partial [Bacillota bacterium]|nr:phosphatidate cytidylyltransferase [Bacillota bacterium]
MTFIVRILFLSEARLLLLMLFLLVFGNDTFAYIFGMLFGKKSRNILSVSPNKSLVGFIGGGVMTIVLSLLW